MPLQVECLEPQAAVRIGADEAPLAAVTGVLGRLT